MNQVPDPGNVVKIGERQGSDERGGELLRSVRSIAMARTQTLAGSLFENVDDDLFDLAEKAENNSVQTQYFDGMREVRKKRQLVERLFLDHINRNFNQFASGKTDLASTDTGSRGGTDGELSLVDDSELEESLAVTSMISKAENRYARLLYSVNQRLSVISGGSKVEDTNNPLGPVAFARCFRLAMRELDTDVKVKLIIYKLFERYVIAGLEPLYDAVNIELIRAGVLPQLRHRAPRGSSESSTRAAPSAVEQNQHGNYDNYDDEEHEQYREQLYATVNSLLAQRRGAGSRAGHAGASRNLHGGTTMPALSAADLLSAISVLQAQAPVHDASDQNDDDWSLVEIKAALQKQLAKLSASKKAQVSGADEDTIDLVAMLFEYILADRNLPAQMQAMLGRLQIPYLKVAIIDKHLFAQRAHPARRLLDAMAEAAKGWSEESDQDLRFYNEVKSTVDELLKGFDDDVAIFERLLARFQVFIDGTQQRARLAEQRTAEGTRGREKLQVARRTAASAVLSRTRAAPDLPTLLQSILTRPWANYLVLTLLRQGEKSPEWRSALHFIDDLIASARKPNTDEERRTLRESLPGLEKQLRHGLTTVAFHATDVRRLMRALGSFYHAQLGGAPVDVGNDDAEQADSTPVIPDTVEAIATPEEADSTEADQNHAEVLAEDNPALEKARELRVSNWVEFIDANDQRERAKLSWISPISGKYLFVNRRGLKVCDMTLQGVAASIDAGTTVVLEEVPLFDRALDAIVERLKTDRDSNPTPPVVKSEDNAAPNAK